jgi:hypothetical protein
LKRFRRTPCTVAFTQELTLSLTLLKKQLQNDTSTPRLQMQRTQSYYYQNMSVLRKAIRYGYAIRVASWFRPNSEQAPTLLNPFRTIRQTFLGAERNSLAPMELVGKFTL